MVRVMIGYVVFAVGLGMLCQWHARPADWTWWGGCALAAIGGARTGRNRR